MRLLLTWAAGALAFGFSLGVTAQSPQAAQAPQSDRTAAQTPTKEQIEFFESKVRPILADRCYKCHSAASGSPRS